jgi:hypothetical protein
MTDEEKFEFFKVTIMSVNLLQRLFLFSTIIRAGQREPAKLEFLTPRERLK